MNHHLRRSVPQTVWLVGVRSIPFFFRSWSNVLQGIVLRTPQLPKNSKYMFLYFRLFPNRCRCTSTSRCIDLRTLPVEARSLPSSFGFPEGTAVVCVLGNVSTRTRLVLRQYNPIQDIPDATQSFLRQGICRSWVFMNSTKTKYQNRINVHLCFRQPDRSVM